MAQLEPPTPQAIAAIADFYRLDLAADEVEAVRAAVAGLANAVDRLDGLASLAEGLVHSPGSRSSRRPEARENPLGGWYVRCDIRDREDGPLAGKTVAIKDSIAVGGVPLAAGSAVLEGFVPDFDATVVTRVLAAGGTIAGKAACEPMCMSSYGHDAHTGPVRNPYDPSRGSGGSSSGCAALVGARSVDMAIGGDNGGSIRVPSSWCGIYGLKPSWGLVPYTGAMSMSSQIDHLGPMASSMPDLELLLGVLAGPDDLDPRQLAGLTLGRPRFDSVRDLRVGILDEGFAWPGVSEPEVDEAVMAAATDFGKLGAQVSRVSVPLHREGFGFVASLGADLAREMFERDSTGGQFLGYISPAMTSWFHDAWREKAHLLDLPSKVQLVASRFILQQGVEPQLALARNLAIVLRRTYDDALRDVDVLVMPTVTHRAGPLPEERFSPADHLKAAWGQSHNTRSFNICGHPALTVPCALVDGLPVGLMIVGRRGDDAAVVRAGHLFADRIYSPPPPPLQ